MLAIMGGKGSSGKTMTTPGLASALDGPVLVADVDRDMPNLHTMAGVGRPVGAASGAPVREPSVRSHPIDSTVSVLLAFAGTDDDTFERWLRATADDERRAVVDCPVGAGPDAAVPLRVADGVVTVSPLCTLVPRDAVKTAAMARTFGTPVVGCVTSRSRVAPGAVSDPVGASVLGIAPEESSPVPTRSTARAAYRWMADKIPGKE